MSLNDSCCHPRLPFFLLLMQFQLKFFLHLRKHGKNCCKAQRHGWSGGRVSMGSAGRDRRMRAAQNPRLLKRRTPGKRREESSGHESVVQISDAEQLAIDPEAVPEPLHPHVHPPRTPTLARLVQTRNEVEFEPAEDQVWTLDCHLQSCTLVH